MILAAAIVVAAFILDLLLGDPPFRFHPIRLIGLCITVLEKLLLNLGLSGLLGGVLLVAGVMGLSVGGYLALRFSLGALHPWIATVLDLYLTYSCLALADLLQHANEVAEPLDRIDLPQARGALQRIVGRDTGSLEPAGVARGAVESVAENFVDGVLSPLFWYTAGALLCTIIQWPTPTVGGVLAILCYKIVSTLDSMVGYRHGHYLLFGRPAARLDDLANLIPARLSLVILFIGALISGESAGAGWRVARRDRLKHLSPNAGHPESFVAGALGIRLGGPTVYKEMTVDKPWLGDGDDEVGPDHLRRCCKLVYRSSWVSVLLFATIFLILSLLYN
jgi:adenosylcobinamide-phosphate synthase